MENNIVECPDCGGVMVKRTNKNTGHKFLGCSNYPNCTAVMQDTTDRETEQLAPSERMRQNDKHRWNNE